MNNVTLPRLPEKCACVRSKQPSCVSSPKLMMSISYAINYYHVRRFIAMCTTLSLIIAIQPVFLKTKREVSRAVLCCTRKSEAEEDQKWRQVARSVEASDTVQSFFSIATRIKMQIWGVNTTITILLGGHLGRDKTYQKIYQRHEMVIVSSSPWLKVTRGWGTSRKEC